MNAKEPVASAGNAARSLLRSLWPGNFCIFCRITGWLLLAIPLAGRALTNNLALTPPMGWNSWNYFGCTVSDPIIRAQADAMATNGMQAAGYQFINIDDCWAVSRDRNGVIVADPVKFPYGIQALADYVHSKGLKLGIYSDHGTETCAGRPGSYGYEYLDANTYAAWGVDYLKFDSCNWPPGDVPQSDYSRMAAALMQCGHPITFSICAWSFISWMPDTGNLWRTTSDIGDSFSSVLSNLAGNSPSAFVAGPGRWNDPDMLEVGNGGMSFTEDQSHFTLWCIAGAPLIAGDDLTAVSAQTLSILTNAELIAVDQDPAGEQGIQLAGSSSSQIWVKTLGADFTTKAVALLNTDTNTATITVNWTDIGLLAGAATVRDLWAGADLGVFTNSFTTNVPAHGVVALKVVGAPPALPGPGTNNYLSALQTVYSYVGWNVLGINQSISGNPITLNGVTYPEGLGAHAYSGIEYRLGGIASRFQSDIGVDDEVGANGSVVFQVYADGMKIFDSGVLTGGAPHQTVDLDVTGVNRLTLGVTDADDGTDDDHADWAGVRVIVSNTVPAPPPIPAGLSAGSGMPISLAWSATRSAVSYNITRATAPAGPFTALASSLVPIFTDTNIVVGTTYYYAVSAVGLFGESSNSPPASALACAPPAPPSGVVATANTQQVALTWNPVPGATGYTLVRALSSTPFSVLTNGLTGTNYNDLAVTSGVYYSYAVYASNDCAQGGRSAIANAALLPPAAPVGLIATDGGIRAVIQWDAAANAASYNLLRSTNSAGPFLPVATNLNTLYYLDTGLVAGTTYYYEVAAVSSAGDEADSAPAIVPASAPLPPGWTDQDIGGVGLAGSGTGSGNSLVMQGGGADIWNTADAFNFAYTTLTGDGRIVALVNLIQETDPWAKAAVMYRNDNTPGSAFVDMVVSAGSGVSLQWRGTPGGDCHSIDTPGVAPPAWVELDRSGGAFTGYYSLDGQTWTQAGSVSVTLANTALAGLAVTAHNNSDLALAAIDDVFTGLQPPLAASFGNRTLQLSWPAASTRFSLWSTTSLAPPVTWTLVTNPTAIANGQNTITLAPTNGACWYRLGTN
jgi:alpha-galactosidase